HHESPRMSLSPPAARSLRHTRRIVCEGFQRDDGLWDIEAVLIDTKAYRYREPERGVREAGEHVHEMHVRLTVDSTLIVRAVEVDMASRPYDACLGAPPAFQGLVGRSIGPGWRKAVLECAGGSAGCTHVREVLPQMATIAFQTILGWPDDDGSDKPARVTGDPKGFLNGCKAWAQDGPMVAKLYPHWRKA
ncbi:MAG TPA: DUF2889 domain-containing protein, partial [Burkholderiaceae bacterium]|nr:DUF2889 domain-containing protein [Burkholderiaceae bacterium]